MTQIKLRRDTSSAFASSNPILGNGEPAYETDTKKLKIGDGTTAYTQLEYFSAGGSTNITATLPLKIVDGVISLDVDGQTIQIVDGKLHANLDELGNEVNDLSGRVTAVETDVLKKQDKLIFSVPLNQSTVGGNPYITADSSLIKFTRASTATPGRNGTIDEGTKIYAVTNGVIDYTHNLMRVDTPDILNNKYEFFFGLKGMKTSNPKDFIRTGFILANTQTNGVVTPRYYISTPIHNGTQESMSNPDILYSITQGSVSNDYVSYALTKLTSGGNIPTVSQQEGFRGVRMYHNGSKYILQVFRDEHRANTPEAARAWEAWNNYTNYATVDLSDVNSIYMPSNFSTETEASGIDASKTVLYKNDVLTDTHFTSIEKGTEQVNLNIGSGLSVVDGKLTATGGSTGGITKEEVLKLIGNPQSTTNRILITQTLTEEQVIVMPNSGLLVGYYGNSAHAGTAVLYMSKVDANNKRLPALFSTQVIGDGNNCTTCQVYKGDRIMFHLGNTQLSDTGRNPDYGIYLFKSEDL